MDVLITPPRYELKYHLELNSNISNSFLNFLNGKFTKPYEDRSIESLYFDDKHASFYNDSIEGVAKRVKVRLRGYSNTKESNLEYKFKNNDLVWKKIFQSYNKPLDSVSKTYNINHRYKLHPIFTIGYKRKYFQNKNNSIRVTIDSNLQTKKFSNSESSRWKKMNSPNINIIEIKCSTEDLENAKIIESNFNLNRIRNSKYTDAYDLLNK
jgi:SPX domain protein involved in polyphosphate accumulation